MLSQVWLRSTITQELSCVIVVFFTHIKLDSSVRYALHSVLTYGRNTRGFPFYYNMKAQYILPRYVRFRYVIFFLLFTVTLSLALVMFPSWRTKNCYSFFCLCARVCAMVLCNFVTRFIISFEGLPVADR